MRYKYEEDLPGLLNLLTIASCAEESDGDQKEDGNDAVKGGETSYSLFGWARKGRRMRAREKKASSIDAQQRADTV